jgi:hypothetical protein
MDMGRPIPSWNRHCERSEAIHSFFVRRDRLLRFARNDVDGVTPRKAVILAHAGIQYAAVHRDPIVAIMMRPSGRDGMDQDIAVIWGSGKAQYFYKRGLTRIL